LIGTGLAAGRLQLKLARVAIVGLAPTPAWV